MCFLVNHVYDAQFLTVLFLETVLFFPWKQNAGYIKVKSVFIFFLETKTVLFKQSSTIARNYSRPTQKRTVKVVHQFYIRPNSHPLIHQTSTVPPPDRRIGGAVPRASKTHYGRC
jgi:hypothetical protein